MSTLGKISRRVFMAGALSLTPALSIPAQAVTMDAARNVTDIETLTKSIRADSLKIGWLLQDKQKGNIAADYPDLMREAVKKLQIDLNLYISQLDDQWKRDLLEINGMLDQKTANALLDIAELSDMNGIFTSSVYAQPENEGTAFRFLRTELQKADPEGFQHYMDLFATGLMNKYATEKISRFQSCAAVNNGYRYEQDLIDKEVAILTETPTYQSPLIPWMCQGFLDELNPDISSALQIEFLRRAVQPDEKTDEWCAVSNNRSWASNQFQCEAYKL